MKLTFSLFSLLAIATALQADTMSFGSSAATTGNDKGVQTVNISQNPAWGDAFAGSQWVSIAKTGNPSSSGFTVLPNGTTVDFSQLFTLAGQVVSGTLSVMADDTTSVELNGHVIWNAANPAAGYSNCSADPIGCMSSTAKTFNLAQYSNLFLTGVNRFDFNTIQKAGSSFGLDYAGTITTQSVASAPEPTSVALMGSGLIGVFLAARRRRVAHVENMPDRLAIDRD